MEAEVGDVNGSLVRGRPLVGRKRPRALEKAPCITCEEVGTVLFEPTGSFADLFKLSRRQLPTLCPRLRSMFGGNHIDLRQFKTILVFEHDRCGGSVTLAFDDDKALIRPEPYLERLVAPV